MPWKEILVVDQREQFIADWLKRKEPLAWLCEHYGISRKTGSKWVSRFINGGRPALVDLSRRPKSMPQTMRDEVVETLIALRKKYPL